MSAAADRYARYMECAENAWAPAIAALNQATGLRWSVWQTGGMCLALGAARDETERYYMLTAGGPLALTRSEAAQADELYRHWELGLYRDEDDSEGEMVDIGYDCSRADLDQAMAADVAAKIKEFDKLVLTEEVDILTALTAEQFGRVRFLCTTQLGAFGSYRAKPRVRCATSMQADALCAYLIAQDIAFERLTRRVWHP